CTLCAGTLTGRLIFDYGEPTGCMSTGLSFNCGYRDERRDGVRYVAWYPTEEPEREFGYGVLLGRGYVAKNAEPIGSTCPLIIFSHGTHSYPQQSLFLT